MKKVILLSLAAILNSACNAQEDKKEATQDSTAQTGQPRGIWKVNKEFDEQGNLVQYDSIYSWSSEGVEDLSSLDRDSTLHALRQNFYRHFSGVDSQAFGDLFTPDSLFAKQFFDEDFFSSEFGKDFMDMDRIRERMEAMQRSFLERYRTEFEYQRDSLSNDGE